MLEDNRILTSSETIRDERSSIFGHRSGLLQGLIDGLGGLRRLRSLIYVAFFQFALSIAYIGFFCWRFGLGKRLILLHMIIGAGLFLFTTICPGLFLLSSRIRRWRYVRFVVALVPATALALLFLLYVADYISNNHWGNNVNYKVVSHYLFGRDSLYADLLLTSKWILITLGAGFIVIYAVYFVMSGAMVRSLEELLLPGRDYSLFKDQRRALKTGVLVGLLVLGYVAYFRTVSQRIYLGGVVSREPLLSFFTDRNEIYDFNRYILTKRLQEEGPRVRANYPTGQSFQQKNVVIIVVDSLRADRMQVYGYDRPTTPFLTSLFQTGRLRKVEHATASCAESNCGIMSIMSSKPMRGLIPQNFKVYDLLQDQGYDTYFVLSGDHSWYGLKQAYGDDMTYYFDGVQSRQYPPTDDRVLLEGLQNVPDYKGTPAFFFFHLMSAHFRGIKLGQYSKYHPSEVDNNVKGPDDFLTSSNNYDNGVIQSDAIIQGIFEGLRQRGYLSDSLVVILADHGEGLGEHDGGHGVSVARGYGHGDALYQECVRIPLLFYDDSEISYQNLDFANQIDVAPTIVNRLGLLIPSSWQGKSLLNPATDRCFLLQTRVQDPTCYAVMQRAEGKIYKYIYCTGGKKEEMYELVSDPDERHNLMPTVERSLMQDMKQKMEMNLAQN